MSVQLDEALDIQDAGPDYAPTKREEALVNAFRWGHLGLEKLYAKLGLRAVHVCSHFGILSSTKQAESDQSPEPLAHVSLVDLLAELDRRSAT